MIYLTRENTLAKLAKIERLPKGETIIFLSNYRGLLPDMRLVAVRDVPLAERVVAFREASPKDTYLELIAELVDSGDAELWPTCG